MYKLICKIFGHKRIDGVYEDKILPYCDRCKCDLPLTEMMKEIELTPPYPGIGEWEKGYNDCLNEIKKINKIK